MAIKIIKFDLPINGTKVDTLDALRDNLTDEIVKIARSGQLERWFKSRKLEEKSQAVAHAAAAHAEDKLLFIALCEILEVEVHPDDVSAVFDAPPEAGLHVKNMSGFHLYKQLKSEYDKFKEITKEEVGEDKYKIIFFRTDPKFSVVAKALETTISESVEIIKQLFPK